MTEEDPEQQRAFARPPGVDGGFAPNPEPPAYTRPPETVSPQERAVFGRPPGAESFAPAPGERISPRATPHAAVPAIFSQAFGPTAQAKDGFDPEPGSRLAPSGRALESPWWKPDAVRDPWRDPGAPFWLGRGAVFAGGRAEQLDPDQDAEAPSEPAAPEVPAEGAPDTASPEDTTTDDQPDASA